MNREGHTLLTASRKVGCDPTSIYRWLNGTEPHHLFAAKLERVLKRSESLANEGGE